MRINLYSVLLLLSIIVPQILGRRDSKVLLRDVEVLTFQKGKYTTGRRTNPIPQLACTGGTARCSYIPYNVQCYNRGFNGQDVQWECKAELKNKYTFKHVEVICEGYDYPEDPYILVGSCGLEFSLDLTNGGDYNSNYGYKYESNDNSYNQKYYKKDNDLSNIGIGFIAVALVIVLIIYTCLPKSRDGQDSDDAGRGPAPSAPPPPGFRDEYHKRSNYGSGFDSGYSGYPGHGTSYNTGTAGGGGGWGSGLWSGLMGAGVGYLFGRSNRPSYTTGYYPSTSGFSSGYSTGYSGGRSSGGGSSSDGDVPRTATAYGGTRRR